MPCALPLGVPMTHYRAHTGPKFCVATCARLGIFYILNSHYFCIMYIQRRTYPFLNHIVFHHLITFQLISNVTVEHCFLIISQIWNITVTFSGFRKMRQTRWAVWALHYVNCWPKGEGASTSLLMALCLCLRSLTNVF
jgi:hypothetical protein